jgi:hypothetical protein
MGSAVRPSSTRPLVKKVRFGRRGVGQTIRIAA